MILIPRATSHNTQKSTYEWRIRRRVSVALTYIEAYGYTIMAKVKIKKKYFWNRSWKTFTVYDISNPEKALKKAIELLEDYGFTIDAKNLSFEDLMIQKS
ncbi:hypothetical protein [Aquimarina algiphila]|uniref:hypothetical protein n=1 Tax=Aquimarina algiphila TaxID=2047982 RepID=UPI00232CD0FB|nr:hypothetical protein [Aquimarina algiphila]